MTAVLTARVTPAENAAEPINANSQGFRICIYLEVLLEKVGGTKTGTRDSRREETEGGGGGSTQGMHCKEMTRPNDANDVKVPS